MELMYDIGEPMRFTCDYTRPMIAGNSALDASRDITCDVVCNRLTATLTPTTRWSAVQEDNDNGKTSATLTITATADCLLVAAIMYRGNSITISGEGWTKFTETATVTNSSLNQKIAVFIKPATAGTHTVTMTQDQTVRCSMKLMALYETSGLTVAEDRLITSCPFTPTATTGKRRIYFVHSGYAQNSTNPTNAMRLSSNSPKTGLLTAEEARFSLFYDAKPDGNTPIFAYYDSSYMANSAGLLVLDIEEVQNVN